MLKISFKSTDFLGFGKFIKPGGNIFFAFTLEIFPEMHPFLMVPTIYFVNNDTLLKNKTEQVYIFILKDMKLRTTLYILFLFLSRINFHIHFSDLI